MPDTNLMGNMMTPYLTRLRSGARFPGKIVMKMVHIAIGPTGLMEVITRAKDRDL
ncbi:MAG: hypothetical protein Q9187_003237, partial [Circinaria calcarea]